MSRRRGSGGVQAPVDPILIDGASVSELNFSAACENLDDFIYFIVYGDDGKELGGAIAKILQKHEKDSDGVYLELKYLGCSEGYYRWYIQNEGRRGGLPREVYHHLCRRHVSRCSRALGKKNIIHVQKWTPVSRQEASDLLVEWGEKPLSPEAPLPPHTTASKARSRKPAGMMSLPAAKPEKAVDEDDDDWEDEAEEEPEARPPLKRRRKKVSKVNGQRDAALDAMLDEPLEFVDRPSTGSGASQAETRLQQLRSKLQGKKVEVKSSTTPAAVLASRASATAEKSKQRKPKGNKVLKALGRALSIKSRGSKDKDDDSDDDSECDGLDDDEDDDLARGSWQVKRQRLRKIAEEKPGQLLAQTLASLHEQLETTTGEEAKDPLAPIMVRYLLSMVVPRYNQLQGTDRYRELRTLCQSLDLLLKGKVDSAADVLIQRVKSLLMSVRDGSDQFGRYLELIPEEALGVSFEESVFARELAVKQAKSDSLLKKGST